MPGSVALQKCNAKREVRGTLPETEGNSLPRRMGKAYTLRFCPEVSFTFRMCRSAVD